VSPPKPVAAPLPKIEERPAPGPDRGPSPAPSPVPVVTPPSASPGVGGAEPSKGVSLIDTPVPRTTAPSQVASIPRDTGITHVAHPTGGYQVRPGYPSSAKRLGIQGTTMLRVYVLEDGRVGDVVVDASAGHADMDQAAADAVRRWRFDPARRGTEKVAMWVRIPFEFKLR
jgi:protein TonB